MFISYFVQQRLFYTSDFLLERLCGCNLGLNKAIYTNVSKHYRIFSSHSHQYRDSHIDTKSFLYLGNKIPDNETHLIDSNYRN